MRVGVPMRTLTTRRKVPLMTRSGALPALPDAPSGACWIEPVLGRPGTPDRGSWTPATALDPSVLPHAPLRAARARSPARPRVSAISCHVAQVAWRLAT